MRNLCNCVLLSYASFDATAYHASSSSGVNAGLPNYNDARVAYGLSSATSFEDVTDDAEMRTLLENAYGGDIELLDAVTGALAEGSSANATSVFGDLLQAREGCERAGRLYSTRGIHLLKQKRRSIYLLHFKLDQGPPFPCAPHSGT